MLCDHCTTEYLGAGVGHVVLAFTSLHSQPACSDFILQTQVCLSKVGFMTQPKSRNNDVILFPSDAHRSAAYISACALLRALVFCFRFMPPACGFPPSLSLHLMMFEFLCRCPIRVRVRVSCNFTRPLTLFENLLPLSRTLCCAESVLQ